MIEGFEKKVAPISDLMSNIFVFELFISPLNYVSIVTLKSRAVKRKWKGQNMSSAISRATEKGVLFFCLKNDESVQKHKNLKRTTAKFVMILILYL